MFMGCNGCEDLALALARLAGAASAATAAGAAAVGLRDILVIQIKLHIVYIISDKAL